MIKKRFIDNMNTSEYLKIIDELKQYNDVTLVAVSKTKPTEDILELYKLGQRDFGENKVQEFIEKYEQLPKDIRWHFIGHLQTNKVKNIIGKVHLIHSVESIKLANEINKFSKKLDIVTDILVQVNFSNDPNKFGIDGDKTFEFLEKISHLTNIKIRGLMMIPRYDLTESQLDVLFSKFKGLSLDIIVKNIDNINMDFLSFGMSEDYKIAIKNGSNMIRVGSKIFGKR